MNRSEAYSSLGLTDDASEDDVKSRFRELSKKLHPDKNKDDPDAEQKFKDINSAYQRIVNPSQREQQEDSQPDISEFDLRGFGFGGAFNNIQRFRHANNIKFSTNITFAESILGCNKEITYSREIKCNSCKGQGKTKLKTDCKKCGGNGQQVIQNGNMMYITQCECAVKIKFNKCSQCNNGVISSQTTVNVNIPGGIENKNILKLNNMGNFVGSIGHSDQYTDALLSVDIEKDNELRLENDYVVSDLNISLLEALKGCDKKIKTVLGEKEVKIKPLSKNKEEIIVPNVGINKRGPQKVILNVSYPNDVDQLIKIME